jgi:hypothetical protein
MLLGPPAKSQLIATFYAVVMKLMKVSESSFVERRDF